MPAGPIITADVNSDLASFSVDIGIGQTISPSVDMKAKRLHSFRTPANLVTCNLTFLVADADGANFLPLYNADGTLYTITDVRASRAYLVDFQKLYGIRIFQVVSSATQTTDTKTLTFVGVPR